MAWHGMGVLRALSCASAQPVAPVMRQPTLLALHVVVGPRQFARNASA